VCSPGEALAEAGQLWQQAQAADGSEGELPLDVVYTVAMLHWCRYLALPDGKDREEHLQAAAGLFASILDHTP
jgi:hypothetical protein